MGGDEHPDSMLARLRERARQVAAGEITEPGEEVSKEQLRARSEEPARLWQPWPRMPEIKFASDPPEPTVIDVGEITREVKRALADSRRSRKPTHRLPKGQQKSMMRALEKRIKQRIAGEVIRQTLAAEFGISTSQAFRYEQYVKAGWPLSRSNPDFRIIWENDGLVYLPRLEKAKEILASERSRRRPR